MTHQNPVNLILDWDGTLTTRDTLSTIASIGYLKRTSSTHESQSSSLPPWSYFVNTYIADYAAHKDSYKPKPADRRTIAEEASWLRSLADIERTSVERVEGSGLFRGVTGVDIREGARKAVEDGSVELRWGWDELIRKVQRSGGTVGVLSVSWSGTFIKEALRFSTQTLGGDGVDVERIEISANDIELDVDGSGTGNLTRCFERDKRGIWTGEEKARVLKNLLAKSNSSRRSGETVYVGDSISDLESLIQADVGICLRAEEAGSEQRGLEEALSRICMECSRIAGYRRSEQVAERKATRLWWARDFEEINKSTLFGEEIDV